MVDCCVLCYIAFLLVEASLKCLTQVSVGHGLCSNKSAPTPTPIAAVFPVSSSVHKRHSEGARIQESPHDIVSFWQALSCSTVQSSFQVRVNWAVRSSSQTNSNVVDGGGPGLMKSQNNKILRWKQCFTRILHLHREVESQ
ncbi:hypothetical protein CDEST_12472 [Colletotrichum destructivum]|uniref:Secreted protein n=1 Tax=Colletotrichum destructivum TaxID=34406 RepID=A0AAX4IWE6_9PEZI|nr:hypothetical protein CDEST_12472 [Colletotrichum destructivum]